ncbi:hypothetical protein ACOMHN_013630 [Nucella lapillus]
MNTSTVADAEMHQTTVAIPWADDAPSLENQVAILLWKVWPPCLLVLGTFGNVATIFVMRRIKNNHSSQHIILMALAVSDLCLLYVSVLRQWLYFLFHVDVYDLHTAVCKLSWWLIYVTSTSSSWLLTSVTIQRTMAVTLPHKMKVFCSTRRTWTVIAFIVSLACLLHSHFVLGMEMSEDKCTFGSEQYEDFIKQIWAWVDLTVFTLLPSVCLLVCDTILSLTLFKATSTISATIHTITNANTEHINNTRRKTASRTTIMILALSCTFLVLTMPVCVYLIWDYYGYASATQNTRLWTRQGLASAVTMLLWYTNSAVNFLLYCFTGTRFRGEFFRWHFFARSVDTLDTTSELSLEYSSPFGSSRESLGATLRDSLTQKDSSSETAGEKSKQCTGAAHLDSARNSHAVENSHSGATKTEFCLEDESDSEVATLRRRKDRSSSESKPGGRARSNSTLLNDMRMILIAEVVSAQASEASRELGASGDCGGDEVFSPDLSDRGSVVSDSEVIVVVDEDDAPCRMYRGVRINERDEVTRL